MFEKILVCLDGSILAEQILPYILAESRRLGKVILLRVLATPEYDLPIGVPGAPGGTIHTAGMLERFDKAAKEAPGYLELLAQPLRAAGIDVENIILEGVPSEAIINYAGLNGVTLIALATHGHSGIRQVIVGSTAESLLRHSGLPVLMITPKKHRSKD